MKFNKFPDVDFVVSKTSTKRDKVIDFVRIFSLVVVVTAHASMLLTVKKDSKLELKNILDVDNNYHWITWIFQVLPLFFFAGGAALSVSWNNAINSKTSWGVWMWLRAKRLYQPLFLYIPVVSFISIWIHIFKPYGLDTNVIFIAYQLLWFIGAYVVIISLIPILNKINEIKIAYIILIFLLVLIFIFDQLDFKNDMKLLHYFNIILVWLVPVLAGIMWYKKWLPEPQISFIISLLILFLALYLVFIDLYDVPMVSVTGHKSNLMPPSLILAFLAIFQILIIKTFENKLNKMLNKKKIWWKVAIGNLGSMTIYLWHMPVLLVLLIISQKINLEQYGPDYQYFWFKKILFLFLFLFSTLVVFICLSPFENANLKFWDSNVENKSKEINLLTGILVLLSGLLLLLNSNIQPSTMKFMIIGLSFIFLFSAKRLISKHLVPN